MGRKIGELFYELRAQSQGLKGDLDDAEKQFDRFTKFVIANPLAAIGGLSVAFAGVAIAAARAAEKVEAEFRPLIAMFDLTTEGAASLRGEMESLSRGSGKAREELAALFTSIGENGPDGAQNIQAMADAAVALQKATGKGDLKAFASGIDLITDVFSIDPSNAKQIAATLFEVAKGRAPLEDVLTVIQKFGPAAQVLGINFETVAAAVTRLLSGGSSPKQVASQLNELAAAGVSGREEILRLGAAGIDGAKAMADLNRAVNTFDESLTGHTEHVRNDLHNAWLDFGKSALPPVNAGYQLLTLLLKGARTEFDLLTQAAKNYLETGSPFVEGKRTPKPTVDKSTPLVLTTTAPFTADMLKSEESIGAALSRLSDQAKKLGDLSVATLKSMQRELLSLLDKIPASSDHQREAAQKLIKTIGEELPGATKKASDAADGLRKSAADLAASLGDKTVDTQIADAQRRIDEWAASAKKAEFPAAETKKTVEELNAALAEYSKRVAEASAQKSVDLSRQVTQILTTASGDTIAQVREQYAALIEQLEKAADAADKTSTAEDKLTAQRAREAIPALKRQGEQFVVLAGLQKEFAEGLRNLSNEEAAGLPVYGTKLLLYRDLGVQEQSLRALLRDQTLDTKTRIAIEEQLNRVLRQRTELFPDNEQTGPDFQAAFKFGDGLAYAASQALSLVDAIGKGNDGLKAQLANVIQVGKGIADLATAAQRAGGLGAAFKDSNNSAQAIGAVGSIVGAFIGVFDFASKDLAKHQAKAEQARLMFAQFSRALDDFIDATVSSLDRAIGDLQQRAIDIANSAPKPEGFGNISSVAELDSTVEALAKRIAAINAEIAKLGSEEKTDRQRKELQQQVASLDAYRLALIGSRAALDVNTAAERERHRQSIADANELLDVRFLEATGRDAEAAALRATIAFNAEYRQAILDTSDAGRAYVVKLLEVRQAEIDAAAAAAKLAEIEKQRASALSQLSDENDILGGSSGDKLQRGLDTIGGLFDNLKGIGDGLLLDTEAGLNALHDRLVAQFLLLEQDGITAEEQPIVNAIKQLLGLVSTSLADLPDAFDPFTSALEAFGVNVRALGLSLDEQFSGLLGIFRTKFGDILGDGFDLDAAGGPAAIKARLQSKISEITADGVITDAERPMLDAFQQLLDGINAIIESAATQAQSSADLAAQAAKDAQAEIDKAIAADAQLQAARNDFTTSEHDKFLRASGKTLQADLEAAQRATDAAVARAKELGLGEGVISEILRTGALTLDSIRQRAADDAARLAETAAQANDTTKAVANVAIKPDVKAFFQGVSETTLLSFAAITQTQAADVHAIRALIERNARSFVGGLPPAPVFAPSSFGGGASSSTTAAVTSSGFRDVHFHFTLPANAFVSAADARSTVRDAVTQAIPELERQLGRRLGVQRLLTGDLSA